MSILCRVRARCSALHSAATTASRSGPTASVCHFSRIGKETSRSGRSGVGGSAERLTRPGPGESHAPGGLVSQSRRAAVQRDEGIGYLVVDVFAE